MVLNMNKDQLEGTLYIGFPKDMTFNQADNLFDEISDYIDNNDLSLEALTSDEDYSQLIFQKNKPSIQDKCNFFFMEMDIVISKIVDNESNKDELKTNFINILSVNFCDVCELLHAKGYVYNDQNDFWFKSNQDSN